MEDFYENKIGVVCEILGLFGVFDGHGGGWAAEYIKHNLFSNQIKHPKFIFDNESVIDQPDEKQRIEEAGGFIRWAGTWRVCDNLAVSRAFGDRFLKPYLVVDPEIQEEIIDRSLEFLIIASDGLWDVVISEEAVEMVKLMDDPEEAAKTLMQEAYMRESADKITCGSSSTAYTSNCVHRNCCNAFFTCTTPVQATPTELVFQQRMC